MKLLYYILAALLLASCLSGCGQDANAAKYAQTFEALLTSQRAGGVTLAGGKVAFVTPGAAPGTMAAPTNLKAIYADRNKTQVAANPYTLDANGTAQVFGDGLYDIYVYNSAGVLKYTWEDVRIQEVSILNPTLLSDYASLSAAITAIGSTPSVLTIDQDVTVSADTTIPANVELRFTPGSVMTVSSTKTLTINGTMTADLSQKFAGAGTVTVSANIPEAYPQWWYSGSGSASSAIQAALDSGALTVSGMGATFLSATQVNLPSNVKLERMTLYDPAYRTTFHRFLSAVDKTNVLIDDIEFLGDNSTYALLADGFGYGDGVINGNGVYFNNVTGGVIRNIKADKMVSGVIVRASHKIIVDNIESRQGVGATGGVFTFIASYNSYASNIRAYNGGDGAVFIYNGVDCHIDGGFIEVTEPATYSEAGAGIESASGCSITNFKTKGSWIGFIVAEAAQKSRIANCVAEGSHVGFYIGPFGYNYMPSEILLENNRATGMVDKSMASYPLAGYLIYNASVNNAGRNITLKNNYFGRSNVGKALVIQVPNGYELQKLMLTGNTFEASSTVAYDWEYNAGNSWNTATQIMSIKNVFGLIADNNTFVSKTGSDLVNFNIDLLRCHDVDFSNNTLNYGGSNKFVFANNSSQRVQATGNIVGAVPPGGYYPFKIEAPGSIIKDNLGWGETLLISSALTYSAAEYATFGWNSFIHSNTATVNLPAATVTQSSNLGNFYPLQFNFSVITGGTLTVEPDGTDTIQGLAAGAAKTMTAGQNYTFICNADGKWEFK